MDEAIPEDVSKIEDVPMKSENESVQNKSYPSKCQKLCVYCNRNVINMPRHLRDFHRFAQAVSKYYSDTMKKQPTSHCGKTETKLIQCPVAGCQSTVKYIENHLKGTRHAYSGAQLDFYKQLAEGKMYEIKQASSTSSDESHPSDIKHNDSSSTIESISQEHSPSSMLSVPSITLEGIQKEIQTFQVWLTMLSGGQKSPDMAQQMCKRVEIVLESFGLDFDSGNIPDKLNHLEITFIEEQLKSKQASTVKNYLLDFKKFSNWAANKNKPWMPVLSAQRIDAQCKCWCNGLQPLISKRKMEKKETDKERIITIEHIQKYLAGKRATDGQEILVLHHRKNLGVELKKKDHALARNLLILKLVIQNASRAGPIVNLKIDEVNKARNNVHNGRHVINVLQHKTQLVYGAAQISLDEDDFRFLVSYIENIRSRIPNLDPTTTEDVFVTWNGRPLVGSEVANIISVELCSAIEDRENRGSCTIIRKSIVSILLSMGLGDENERDLARLMKHTQGMQRNVYDVSCADPNMARMSNLVKKIMTGQKPTESDMSRGVKRAYDEIDSDAESQHDTQHTLTTTDTEIETECPVEIYQPDNDQESTGKKSRKTRWPNILREEIRQLFKKYIDNRSIITQDVKEILNENDHLYISIKKVFGLKNESLVIKKVYDLIRSFYRYL